MATLTQQLEAEAESLETYARRAFAQIGARAAYWQSLQDSAAQYGILPGAVIGDALAAANYAADQTAAKIGGAILDLFEGRAELVPCRIGSGPIFYAVRDVGSTTGELGFLAIVLRVLTFATVAAFAHYGWKIGNFYLEVRKVEADAVLLQANTANSLARQAAATTDPTARAALAEAAARASEAAADSTSGTRWYDSVLKAVGTAAAVGGGAGLLWFGVLWLLGRSRGRSSSRRSARA